ncbi:hypothetical protein RJ639_042777 [Escallonia herrerae]|uniref:Gnk2-homologous domain-containing protein n=1 Tax=Escallonia herrerae TaxID=1293975 RepID=A0AA88WG77_9ASTE|nr:hypothetical protein RJ639_042777 [Escallonia herrerae]
MALIDDFESVRASLLHRSPFPTLEAAISDLIYEEKWLQSLKSQRTDAVLAISASRPFKGNFSDSRQKRCKYCHESDSPIENSISTSQFSISEIADILKQVLSNTGNPHSTALSTISEPDTPQTSPLETPDLPEDPASAILTPEELDSSDSHIPTLETFPLQSSESLLESQLPPSHKRNFLMKDLGVLSYFLGLEISSSVDGYTLSQAKYASDLLSRAGLTDSKTAPTPLEPNAASCMAKQPKGGSVRKFARGNTPGSDNATIYALFQCSPDISGQRCYECLNGTGGYCNGRLGARYQNPSCNCGCGISPFYNETPADAFHHSHRIQVNPVHPPYGILSFNAWRPTEKPIPTFRPSVLHLLGYTCADTGNYTRDSAYSSNLDDVIYSLSTNTTSFSSGSDPDSVNGIALCRGDINQDVCRRCVDDSTRRLRQLCTDQKEAIGWYDDCMVRYSDRSIYQSLETSPDSYYVSEITVPDVGTFNKALGTLLGSLRYEAAQGGSALKFASGNVSAPNNMTIYALVQCTPDLTAQQCDNCLKGTSWCCDGYTGARYQNPSCNIGYAFTQFYNVSPAAAPQALPPPVVEVRLRQGAEEASMESENSGARMQSCCDVWKVAALVAMSIILHLFSSSLPKRLSAI